MSYVNNGFKLSLYNIVNFLPKIGIPYISYEKYPSFQVELGR